MNAYSLTIIENIWRYIPTQLWTWDSIPNGKVVSGLSHRCGKLPWWRHQMEKFSALLAICAGNSPVPGEFSAQRPVTRSSGVFFDLRLNKRLSKQSQGWWFETLSRPFWRHCNAHILGIKSLLCPLIWVILLIDFRATRGDQDVSTVLRSIWHVFTHSANMCSTTQQSTQ